jgi:hypothetical protein
MNVQCFDIILSPLQMSTVSKMFLAKSCFSNSIAILKRLLGYWYGIFFVNDTRACFFYGILFGLYCGLLPKNVY